MVDKTLLELLVCPLCKGPLQSRVAPETGEEFLSCQPDAMDFPVKDGIPVLLVELAQKRGNPDECK